MKNKGLIILISSIFIILLCSIIFIFNLNNINNKLLNNKWYHYDYKDGFFDIVYFDGKGLIYNIPNDENITNEYSFCKKYKYNKINKKFTFDCGKTITVKEVSNNNLKIIINSKEIDFYTNIEDSINHEFKKYYNLSTDEYAKNNKQALDIIKISNEEITSILNEEDYSKIIFLGSNCNSISCVLIKDIIEKWISFSKNVYYVDSNSLDNDLLIKLNNINNNFETSKANYNDIYPVVYVVSNNKIIDKYQIKCKGFDCSNYYNK